MKKVCCVGVNDTPRGTTRKYKSIYTRWRGILSRCYNPSDSSYNSYGAKGVYVCEEWLTFSVFLKWCLENYIDGYHIDKDIKGLVDVHGYKYYSPKTCMFVEAHSNIIAVIRPKGEKCHHAHPIDWYENNEVTETKFKDTCARKGWDVFDFECIWLGARKGSTKSFLYFHKASTTPRPTSWKKFFKYQTTPVRRDSFLRYCRASDLNIEDFISVYNGLRDATGKKYYYFILKSRVIPY